MSPAVGAVVGGLAGAFGMLAIMMSWKKLAVLDPYVENVAAAAAGSSIARNEMAARAALVTRNLERLANERTEQIAQMVAEQYLADVYGLTAARIAGMKRLATAFGV